MLTGDKTMAARAAEYMKLKVSARQASDRMEALAVEMTAYLERRGETGMVAGDHLVTLSRVSTRRLDTARMRAELGEEALRPYTVTGEATRLTVR